MDAIVKNETLDAGEAAVEPPPRGPPTVIDLSSSDSESEGEREGLGKRSRDSNGGIEGGTSLKRPKQEFSSVLPLGFLDPIMPGYFLPPPQPISVAPAPMGCASTSVVHPKGCKQFWKAGDYEGGARVVNSAPISACMDHVRVHPKFLHSNATSHKWALGALAELLDNSLDEVCNGATYVNVDMLMNKKDGSRMLLVEDNGGGMDPDRMRQCMSLGYSAKSKSANTIGQYGNGFKTSTMRLGADVIVFSRSCGKEGRSPTQTIGLLSYTFLRKTGKEDIVVPMIDYEKGGQVWNKMSRSSLDWNGNLKTIVEWSPYTNEADLLQQFSSVADQGTRIIIYNLWEDDQGELELDFDVDKQDIQIRGVNRDDKKIEMARRFPNSRHFLTYRHSLRSYTSILYRRLPCDFRIILRGKEIEHHIIETDMMLRKQVTYRPTGADGVPKDPNMIAEVTIGFVKDAKEHVDVQGFNVYHKNRLIKPFWRVWNAAGSDGRGVIGVLEADFVEPAHDKQGFERTTVLSRLETRLVLMQKKYWSENCHKIGYAPRLGKKLRQSEDRGSSPDSSQHQPSRPNSKTGKASTLPSGSGRVSSSKDSRTKSAMNFENSRFRSNGTTDSSDGSDPDIEYTPSVRFANGSSGSKAPFAQNSFQRESGGRNVENQALNGGQESDHMTTTSQSKAERVFCNGNGSLSDSEMSVSQLKVENEALKESIMRLEESMSQELDHERSKSKSLTNQLQEAERKLEEANKEQEALIDIFSEERNRRDKEEENLRKKLKDASITIQDLLEKLSTSRSDPKPDH